MLTASSGALHRWTRSGDPIASEWLGGARLSERRPEMALGTAGSIPYVELDEGLLAFFCAEGWRTHALLPGDLVHAGASDREAIAIGAASGLVRIEDLAGRELARLALAHPILALGWARERLAIGSMDGLRL